VSFQALLTTLLLPPIGLVLLGLAGSVLALRGRRLAALVPLAASVALLLLATPMVAGLLFTSLERNVPTPRDGAAPAAIVVLGAEVTRGQAGLEVGALTLERLRAGAALARRSGLPLLVTGGLIDREDTAPVAALMAQTLAADFGLPVRWIEPRARDTRENAAFSTAMLREAGIDAAYLVTHGWHMARAMEAFGRQGFRVVPAPVRLGQRRPGFRMADWVPQPEALQRSWFAIREWVGRGVYALRD
jgi:uncharacterized SAM-binding protein YcdF (DUF218 family)